MSLLWDLKSVYINDLDKLEELSLASGDLRIFPVENFRNLPSLMYLDLGCNQLQSVGDGNWNFSVLDVLILSYNFLTAVRAEQLKGLENLSKLELSHNRISYFSLKVLDNMPKLMNLDLSFNRLEHVSDYSQQHSNLFFLQLGCNLFVSLEPLASNGLKSLYSIDYYNNSIKDPPIVNSQYTVSSALELSLSDNAIEVLSPLFFDTFPHLSKITVAKNKIRHIKENTFQSVLNVSAIYMSSNKIHTIPGNLFHHLQNLAIVELQSNRIQTFHPNVFNHLATYVQFITHSNPIVCDCQALPLSSWLRGSEMPLEEFPTCQFPEEVQNQNIYYVKLPKNCPYSTRMPASSNVSQTPPTSTTKDYDPLYLSIIVGAFLLIFTCVFPLYLYLVRK